MKTATEIAVQVRAARSLDEAAALIQMFADREAIAAVVRAAECSGETVSRTLAVMFESPLVPR